MLPQPQPQPAAARVLVADDDVLVRVAFAEALRTAGFVVIEASCADEALGYIRAGGKVDLVFSDIQMPGGIDGRQLAALMAEEHPEIPVVLASGETHLGAGAPTRLFVAKPFSLEHTVALLLSLLGLRLPEGGS
ncbi:response regulator [Paraburkholderia sp. SUR17]|uniref:response regulator n=1 Tax=Paraburkholderia sp. SUR17 TaxID=3034358 RepID=UPI002407BE10|nr:response regulator [Paraburkholderia sp. SUR17]WEY37706.1 response regulator [Paraburkholderia sp. SUR17]